MPELPRISGDQAIKVFLSLGFYQARQKGSHVVMRRDNKGCVCYPVAQRAGRWYIAQCNQAGITVEEFVKAMK